MADSENSRERRQDPRIEKVNLVQLSRFDEEGARADLAIGRTLDLSRGGLRVELLHALPLRSVVTVTLALDDQIVEVTGTVVHLAVIDAERCSMGIEFTKLSDEARQLIEARVPEG